MTPIPLSPYALQKLALEHYSRIFCDLYGLETFALRYFNVFGPRQDPASDYAAVIPLFVNAFRRSHAPIIHGDGGQTRDFTFVRDVVSANLCCLDVPAAAAGQVYNVARGDRISVLDLCLKIRTLMGGDIEPAFAAARAGDVRDSQADASLARVHLGWVPAYGVDEGLRITVDWLNTLPS